MGSALNTDVEHGGRTYHVQTENASRRGPAVETLVFDRGEILVRMTASRRPDADMRETAEQQHWDLVRKIRNGMLDDEEARAAVARDAAVRDLMVGLDGRLDEILAERKSEGQSMPLSGVRRFPLSDWWYRHLKRVSVVVRW
jgi:hypothetical protein